MNLYVLTIIITSLIGGIVTSLASSKENGVKKHLNLLIGIISTIVLIAPIVNIVKQTDKLQNGFEKFLSITETEATEANKLIIATSTENICNGIKEAVTKEFNIKASDVEISAQINDESIESVIIESITITLKNNATWNDSDKIKSYVSGLVGCKVVINKI